VSDNPGALFAAANAAARAGRPGEAIAALDRLLAIQPGNLKALQLRAQFAHRAGDIALAQALLERAAGTAGRDPEVLRNLGVVRLAAGDPAGAVAALARARAAAPKDPAIAKALATAHIELGNAAMTRHAFDDASAAFERAVALDSDLPGARLNWGNALYRLERHAEAAAVLDRIPPSDPSYAESRLTLAGVLIERERFADAIATCEAALARQPNDARLFANLGVAFAKLGEPVRAIAAYRRALALAPGAKETLVNLGRAFEQQGDMAAAMGAYRDALALDPAYEPALDLIGKALLLSGRLREGWGAYRNRVSMPREKAAEFFRDPLPERLDGTPVHVRRDQGLGDEIFFLRFAPALAARGARVHYEAGAKVAALVERLPFLTSVFAGGSPPESCRYRIAAGDLPYCLGLGDRDFVPSVRVSTGAEADARAERLLAAAGPPPYWGVSWRGGTRERLGLFKEVPVGGVGAAFRGTPATVLILQRAPEPEELAQFAAASGRPAFDLSELNDDLDTILAVLTRLDEYVAVSNTNVHLRAAAGRTARVLIPAPEFRWMAAGEESPWFPGTRLYRRGSRNDWGEALGRLRADLGLAGRF
jgi:Flp pilus assembly protein TadD